MRLLQLGKKQRDIDEFEDLIGKHLDGLYGAALRFTRNSAQAEDLVQDTVVRALRFRERFEPGTNFRAWIFTILTNTFIHRYRRQKREREALEGVRREDVARELRSERSEQQALEPENTYLDGMLSDDVLAALDSLPEEFRAVVVLCDIEGLAYKDIAEAVECPVGTVMSRLYRGRRMLEDKLLGVAIERGIVKGHAGGKTESSVAEPDVLDIAAYRRRKNG
ncbi:MAG: sigma-70 family RNA polymerase sigma factor [Myxococcota bacterium]|mgnify:FL=1